MRTGPAIAAVAVLLALAGCTPSGGPASSSPTPSATPVFASDAEALAAAEKAYAAYLAVSSEISAEGGTHPEAIDSLITKDRLEKEHAAARYLLDRQWHTEGSPTFSPLRLQQLNYNSKGSLELTAYTCLDASKVRVFDAGGTDVTPGSRSDRQPLQLTFLSSEKLPTRLLISGSETWPGASDC